MAQRLRRPRQEHRAGVCRALFGACVIGLVMSTPLLASPTVVVTLHRPAVGEWKLGTVVFAPPQGDCGPQVVEKLMQLLSGQHVTSGPVDLANVIARSGMKFPTFLKASDITALGKHIEADTMFLIRVSQCTYPTTNYNLAHPRNWLGMEDTSKYEYVTTTHASINGTVRLFDLKGGKASKAIPFEATPEVTRKNAASYPDPPPPDKIQGDGIDSVVVDIASLFMPWTEKREFVFFDDKDCNLKAAYDLMKSGDVEHALEVSKKNDEECKANPKRGDKQKRRAAHNLATALYASGDYEAALPVFEEAARLGGEDEQRGINSSKARLAFRQTVHQFDAQVASATLTSY